MVLPFFFSCYTGLSDSRKKKELKEGLRSRLDAFEYYGCVWLQLRCGQYSIGPENVYLVACFELRVWLGRLAVSHWPSQP